MRLCNLLICTLLSVLFITPNISLASNWERIEPGETITITHSNGDEETISPSCAMPTLSSPVGEIPNNFAFYFEQGESDNLLIYFNGGGACWDDASCLASLALANDDSPTTQPTFNPSMYSENTPTIVGGILKDNSENPFKSWSKVFIPYCTGDLHIGSNDFTYVDETGVVSGFPGTEIMLRHRGYDNTMAVREWLKSKFQSNSLKPDHVLLTGSSAGGYGATFNFPYFQEITTKKISLMADASMAVISGDFVDNLLGYNGNWAVENSLHKSYRSMIGKFNEYKLNKQLVSRLSYGYPRNRFAQYSTGTDTVQIQFLKISDQIAKGNSNPYSWELSESDLKYIFRWQVQMNASVHFLSAFTWNYQFYIGDGTCHTVLTDFCEKFGFPTTSPSPFYNEQSAEGIAFKDWLYDFATQRRFREKSVAYYH
ncbi:hypothetical protein J5X92_10770 [Alteromonas sp. K632G]|jgi:hypothetical protein|uniref:pectin acetylesterase-family hydrolase n=1 Tax=Alteromonas sp. K632G TaxID=2820757 RepID=UPI001AD78959|nr:pectin acetylesterase-family hydrolase [Alteromonas sp. K632G]MBO7922702.1 hypothetical protein [Alteromonas sp. K632G]